MAAAALTAVVVAGCVNLSKPENVAECESAPGGCVDNPDPPDAPLAPDTRGTPDLRWGNEPTGPRPEAPDAAKPDLGGGQIDVALSDTALDNRPGDPISPGEAGGAPDGKNDGSMDTGSGPEAGPESGPEPGPERGPEPRPEPGPEPAREPGPEPGPEPGKESGPEPGPEPAPEPGPDAGPDASTAPCATKPPVSGGNIVFNTTAAFCFVTCDGMQNGWGCDSFDHNERTVKVNATAVNCGAPLPAKKPGGYYYFEIGAGGHNWDAIHWSGTRATSCEPPAGGFSP